MDFSLCVRLGADFFAHAGSSQLEEATLDGLPGLTDSALGSFLDRCSLDELSQ